MKTITGTIFLEYSNISHHCLNPKLADLLLFPHIIGGEKHVNFKQDDKFIDPYTGKVYVVTVVVFDGNYVILREAGGDGEILMSQEELKKWGQETTDEKN